jgi:capsular polysaccharide export protein
LQLQDKAADAPFIATSVAIARLPNLAVMLGAPVSYRREVKDFSVCAGVLAWGRKPSADVASAFATRQNLALLQIEDGFLRSVGLGNQEPPLSIVVDDVGIYYDALKPSRLDAMITNNLTEHHRLRTHALIAEWRLNRVSKYNHAREYQGSLPENYVLVVDQTFGDASVEYGLAKATHFNDMLEAALAENPYCKILIKIHPDVICGTKRGYFNLDYLRKNSRIILIIQDVHPVSLIEQAQVVYCVTSQIGFEALIWGKKVRTFGMPFYAGWGLTHDERPHPEWRYPVPLENLVHAALIDYPRYINPETNSQCQVEILLSWMGLQRRMRERFPAHLYAHGFSTFKKQLVRSFFQGSHIQFVKKLDQVPNRATFLAWGSKAVNFPFSSETSDIKILRLEDGFLRSVGLGADFQVPPLSWVVDSRGIYYDATRISDIEHLLQTTDFSAALLDRARVLRERIIQHGLTKYNIGADNKTKTIPFPINNHNTKPKIILVPGQVESDASIAFGACKIRRNIDLLREVRNNNPDAYLIYKPHPDVVAGLRRKGVGENLAEQWCDKIVIDSAMGELLTQVDEVHVLTSLAGFEALLRGKQVTCYGQPFYAGWGLTSDKFPISRRKRRLSLDELVAGALILYPLYLSPTSHRFISAEQAVDALLNWKNTATPQKKLPYLIQLVRYLHKLIKSK